MNPGLAVNTTIENGHHESASRAEQPPARALGAPPPERFDLVVVGGDRLAKTAALEAVRLGARVAWFPGATPRRTSESALRCWMASAQAAHQLRGAVDVGVHADGVRVDFQEVRAVAAQRIAEVEAPATWDAIRAEGVDVVPGAVTFTNADTLAADDRSFRFRRAIVVPGCKSKRPAVSGLDEVGYVDRTTIFALTDLPARWAVLGGGKAGCEFAQVLRRLGCEVQLIEAGDTLLPTEEPHAGELLSRALEREGVRLHLGSKASFAERMGGAKALTIEREGERLKIVADEILVALGESSDAQDLDLATAGIASDEDNIVVDDFARTSNPHVYALTAGKATCSGMTHADLKARNAVRNALVVGRYRVNRQPGTQIIETDPAIARVGLSRAQIAAQGVAVESFRVELAEIERAVLDGHVDGYAVLHVARKGSRILGATIVAPHAEVAAGALAMAVNRWGGLRDLAALATADATVMELLCRVAARALPQRLSPRVSGWLKRWFSWRRGASRERSASAEAAHTE